MNLKNVILNKRLLPINACIGGYIIWLMIGMQQPTTLHIQAPVRFYQTPENFEVKAPEHIDILMQSSRKTLRNIDAKNTTAHINLHGFQPGDHIIHINNKNLFLPNSVKLVELTPSEFTITLTPTSVETP